MFSPVHEDRDLRQATRRREGIESLGANNNDLRPSDDKGKDQKTGKRRGPAADDVGRALKSAYDETLREEVPDDFRDLLGKLS